MAERTNPLLAGLTIPSARKGVFKPRGPWTDENGDEHHDILTVSLNGEKVRGDVIEVISDNAVVVKITSPTFRQATIRRGDEIPVVRDEDDMGIEIWRHVDRRESQQRAEAEQFRQEETEKARLEEENRKRRFREAEQAEIAKAAGITEEQIAPVAAIVADPEPRRPVLGPRRNRVRRAG